MRTEREIKAKLRYLEKRKRVNPNFWNIVMLQTYEDLLNWWLGGAFGHEEIRSKQKSKKR